MPVTVTGPYTVGSDGYTYYKFTGSGSKSWTVPDDCSSVDVTVVGGGGSGGGGEWWDVGSGGGAGYMVSRFNQPASGSVTISVGAGGTGILNGTNNGGQSAFGSITANGGIGGGYTATVAGGKGGSGGGARGKGTTYVAGNGGANGADGGDSSTNLGGDGQGTGSTENNPAPCSGTTGIDGILRCGGGGGAGTKSPAASGGTGGGGNGRITEGAGYAGIDDYGGGGGGATPGDYAYAGGKGGSGIVIVRYMTATRKKGGVVINSGVMIV